MPCPCLWIAYAGLPFLHDGLPRTVTLEYERWSNQSWGIHDVERSLVRAKTAIRADGSRANTVAVQHFSYHIVPAGRFSFRAVYRKPQNSGYFAEQVEKVVRAHECGCWWTAEQLRTDRACERMVPPGSKRVGTERLARVTAVRFAYADENGSHEIAMAPDYGCDVLEYRRRTFNSFGLPTSGERFRVLEYVPGEPPAELFEFPRDYGFEGPAR